MPRLAADSSFLAALFRRMAEIARARGLAGMKADVLQGNKPMLLVLQNSGLELRSQCAAGVYNIEAYFNGKPRP